MVSRSRIPRFLSDVARQVGISPHALFAFAGGALLSNDVLRQLAIILYDGLIEYDPASNRLHSTDQSSRLSDADELSE